MYNSMWTQHISCMVRTKTNLLLRVGDRESGSRWERPRRGGGENVLGVRKTTSGTGRGVLSWDTMVDTEPGSRGPLCLQSWKFRNSSCPFHTTLIAPACAREVDFFFVLRPKGPTTSLVETRVVLSREELHLVVCRCSIQDNVNT